MCDVWGTCQALSAPETFERVRNPALSCRIKAKKASGPDLGFKPFLYDLNSQIESGTRCYLKEGNREGSRPRPEAHGSPIYPTLYDGRGQNRP